MNCLGIFAKYWEPGTVKTRLAATIGNVRASALSREFLATLTRRFENAVGQRCVVFSPPSREAAFLQAVGPQWTCVPQSGGDLGQRLRSFFEWAFAQGAQRVVVIGSDSPTIPPTSIDEAWRELDGKEIVLGPTDDGGYYLVGAARHAPRIFDEIPWGTSAVWSATRKQVAIHGSTLGTLAPWYDVDTISDLRRLGDELATPSHEYRALGELVRQSLIDSRVDRS